ncbi:MAG: hypothetical protein IFK94_09290 [Acidobacteria bacterium]|uniref:Toxin HigB-2 n=1 Tax=Candidatus Polarisedimenticola svalbardensis TaxID=2886004 RepID=A0A8J7CD66_9BACT|nr:hypothetical protein [Candidatus Polarisedimenticola svalbardensis]
MEFIETPVFTKEVRRHLDDMAYRALQLALLLRPEQGRLIQGSGGLRKLRWRSKVRGKRGALRLIYYWDPGSDGLYLLFLYEKGSQENLTPTQLKILSRIVREELK